MYIIHPSREGNRFNSYVIAAVPCWTVIGTFFRSVGDRFSCIGCLGRLHREAFSVNK